MTQVPLHQKDAPDERSNTIEDCEEFKDHNCDGDAAAGEVWNVWGEESRRSGVLIERVEHTGEARGVAEVRNQSGEVDKEGAAELYISASNCQGRNEGANFSFL